MRSLAMTSLVLVSTFGWAQDPPPQADAGTLVLPQYSFSGLAKPNPFGIDLSIAYPDLQDTSFLSSGAFGQNRYGLPRRATYDLSKPLLSFRSDTELVNAASYSSFALNPARLRSFTRPFTYCNPAADLALGEVRDVAPSPTAAPTDGQLLTPQQFIQASMSAPLEFVGAEQINTAHGKSCVFKNAQVYVVYTYCSCRNDRRSARDGLSCQPLDTVALGVNIYSRTGGSMQFYVENAETNPPRPIHTVPREEYNRRFRIDYVSSPALAENAGLNDIKRLEQGQAGFSGTCGAGGWTGFNTSNPPSASLQNSVAPASCRGNMAGRSADWSSQAQSFFENPGQQWVDFQNMMFRSAGQRQE